MNIPYIQLGALTIKYRKYYTRLIKSIKNGQFFKCSRKKQRMLLNRLIKVCNKLQYKDIKWKPVIAGAIASLALLLNPSETKAQGFAKLGGEITLNTTIDFFTGMNQRNHAISGRPDGRFVSVWFSGSQDGDIYGQVFSADGTKSGSEFRIPVSSSEKEEHPDVVFTVFDNPIVVFADETNVYYRVFDDAGGALLNSDVLVSTNTTSKKQYPRISADTDGNFVVTWLSGTEDATGEDTWDIYGQLFNRVGQKVGSEFKINTTSDGILPYFNMDVASNGDFVVTWSKEVAGANAADVIAQRFDANGTKNGTEFQVNTFAINNQDTPDVEIASDGSFVITWRSENEDDTEQHIFARRFDSAGQSIGDEFQVSTATNGGLATRIPTAYFEDPYIAMNEQNDFIISWGNGQSYPFDALFRRYASDGSSIEGQHNFKESNSSLNTNQFPKIAMNTSGGFVASRDSGLGYSFYAQRFQPDGVVAPEDLSLEELSMAENTFAGDFSSTISVNDDDLGDIATFSLVAGTGDDDNHQFKILGDQLVNTFFVDFETQNAFNVRIRATDAYGLTVENTFALTVADVHEVEGRYVSAIEGTVFDPNGGTEMAGPKIAMDQNGDYVIASQGYGDDDYYESVYIKRFDAQGAAVGDSIRASKLDAEDYYQINPTVAMDADGDFVVVWEETYDYESEENAIYAQRFDNNGNKVGAVFQVSDDGVDVYQANAEVAMDADGDFVVVWDKEIDGSKEIVAKSYNADGSVAAAEFVVNSTTANKQSKPDVVMDTDGDFVVVWQSSGQDGYGSGVYGRKFERTGAALSTEFLINETTSQQEFSPSVAMDDVGDFIVAWEKEYGGGDYDVYARRFTSAGVAASSEFLVTAFQNNDEQLPIVTIRADGYFAVVWQSDNDGVHNRSIYGQIYDASGMAVGTGFSAYASDRFHFPRPDAVFAPNGDLIVIGATNPGGGFIVYANRLYSTITPTDILIDDTSISEGNEVGDVIGNLSVEDLNQEESHVYHLVAGDGSDDNSSFAISESQLIAQESFDSNTKSSYSVRVRVTDQTGLLFEKQLTILVEEFVNEWDGSMWSAGAAPEGAENVRIAGDYSHSIHGAFDANDLEVESGATLTVDGESTLEVNGDLTNNGNIIIASGASLITHESNIISGNALTIKRNTRYADGKYSFVGTPVEQGVSITGSDLGTNVYKYNESTAYGADGINRWEDASTDQLVPGTGYTQASQQEIAFIGLPNDGTIIHTGTYTEDTDDANEGWNLVSNPYPAAINVSSFLTTNANIEGAVYLWDDNGSETSRGSNVDYIVANGTVATNTTPAGGQTRYNQHLGSAQGFFVKLKDNSDTEITFTETMRVGDSNADANFFRQSTPSYVRINLTNKAGLFKQAVVGWLDDVSDTELDRSFDAKVFNTTASDALYTLKANEALAIQGVRERQEISLGIHISETGHYSLNLELDNYRGQDLYLLDKESGEEVNLSASSYSFYAKSGQSKDRLVLVSKPEKALSLELGSKDWQVYASGKSLYIKKLSETQAAGTFKLYTLTGKEVQTFTTHQSISIDLSNLPKGIYLISNGEQTNKVLLED